MGVQCDVACVCVIVRVCVCTLAPRLIKRNQNISTYVSLWCTSVALHSSVVTTVVSSYLKSLYTM